MPTIGLADKVQPGGAGALEAPRAEIPTLNQEDSAQPPDAGTPSAPREYPSPPAQRPHKAAHPRSQPKRPPRTRNPTTQLNQQEIVRHQASPQPQRDPVSTFFGSFFK